MAYREYFDREKLYTKYLNKYCKQNTVGKLTYKYLDCAMDSESACFALRLRMNGKDWATDFIEIPDNSTEIEFIGTLVKPWHDRLILSCSGEV